MITRKRENQGQVTRNASHFKRINIEEPKRGERMKRTPKHFEDCYLKIKYHIYNLLLNESLLTKNYYY